jgi:hypothetical protein
LLTYPISEPTTSTPRIDRSNITDAPRNVEPIPDQGGQSGSSSDVARRDSDKTKQQEPCDATVKNCDVLIPNNDSDGDLYRYVIFGPLIVLWIIVSVICSVKIKKRLPCWRRQVVTTVTPAPMHGGQPARRSRFGRVTLSRAPPPMMISQPKPAAELIPSAALPPYPGLDGQQPQHMYGMAGAYPPSYPPPAYTANDNKDGHKSLTQSSSTPDDTTGSESHTDHTPSVPTPRDTTEHPQPMPSNPPTCPAEPETVTAASLASGHNQQIPMQQHTENTALSAPPPNDAWVVGYSMGMVPIQESSYPGPPPSYQEATETHM